MLSVKARRAYREPVLFLPAAGTAKTVGAIP